MLRTDALDYHLPPDLIATHPHSPRDAARLLVARRDGTPPAHARVRDLPAHLRPGDLLVFNNTRVLPSRFAGRRADTGGRASGLYLGPGPGAGTWRCMLRAKRLREGTIMELDDRAGNPGAERLELVRRLASGEWIARVESGREDALERVGLTPLPPYILAARDRRDDAGDDQRDRLDYQTVFARDPGSVAAPTAGLHFTPDLLVALDEAGIERAEVTLHVGPGTFKPVDADLVEEHPMHAEWCSMTPDTIERVRRARAEGRRVIAVGTTSARTLETYAGASDTAPPDGPPSAIETRLLVTPGYRWRWVDGLLTNFHLPRSTLLAMVSALLDARPGVPGPSAGGAGEHPGVERLLALYAEAIREGYRFYSFGDAMLVVPD